MIRLAAAMFAVSVTCGTADAAWYEWYVSPEVKGDCGDECYEPPTAWVDDRSGTYRFGVTCDGTIELGGPATETSEFVHLGMGMTIDDRAYGPVNIQHGLKDVFVTPDDESSLTVAEIVDALAKGSSMRLFLTSGPVAFSLNGSRSAIALAKRLC